ncbi:MAG: biotin--[acetyl-CoA-carboxylase] ligase [Treponema sp.]|jgi:BirA family biotin operon repressor/biotin-[acetyl-CoA-carboxylase] ligase|nr:biotin--[acetyl-CoA-carboxylase] ligase [Treponema sp.]
MHELSMPNPFGAPLYHLETVSSTMEESRALALQGLPHGTVITADFQEQGRGRTRGRSWKGKRGENLFFTILLRYPGFSALPKALTLRAGLAVSLAIEDFIEDLGGSMGQSPALRIKWPNDIMIGPKKTAGILTEGDGKILYIGIGVNIAQTEFPLEIQTKATSIALALASCNAPAPEDRFRLLEKILAQLFQELEKTTGQWRIQVEERLYMKDRHVRFIAGESDSGNIIEGKLHGIGPAGELLLVQTEHPKAFITGELDVYRDSE